MSTVSGCIDCRGASGAVADVDVCATNVNGTSGPDAIRATTITETHLHMLIAALLATPRRISATIAEGLTQLQSQARPPGKSAPAHAATDAIMRRADRPIPTCQPTPRRLT